MQLNQYNILQTVILNIKKNNIDNLKKKNMILCCKNSKIDLHKTATINCKGRLKIGVKENLKSKQETRLSMGKNSKFTIEGNFNVGFGSDIRIFNDGEFSIQSGYFNGFAQIVCSKKISIGKNVAIAREVVIRDTDAHSILGKKHEKQKEVKIGNNVWIGY